MKTVLITGGSSGIGFEISRHFAKEGYRLLWVAKPPEELANAESRLKAEFELVELSGLAIDLTKPDAPEEVVKWVEKNNWTVDVLINNAGFGTYGYTNEISLSKELDMIQLNAVCLYKMTRLFLNEMMARDEGTIINISSNSSFQPVPRMNTYASTKAFVRHFSRGIQEELKLQKSKVKVITVCPSAIKDTPFRKTGDMDKVKTFEGLAYTTATEVASDVYKGFKKGKTFIVTGWKMRMLYSIIHLIPYSVQQFLVRRETERGG